MEGSPQEDFKLEKTKNKIKIEKGTRIFYMTTPQKTKQIKMGLKETWEFNMEKRWREVMKLIS